MNSFVSSIANTLEGFAPTLEWAMPYILIALAIILVIILVSAIIVHFVRKSKRKTENNTQAAPTQTNPPSTGVSNQ